MNFKIIVAVDKNLGIGLQNSLPWKFKSDMHFFREMTIGDKNNAIVMGKNTYLSIGKKLPHRENLILSTSMDTNTENINVFRSIDNLCDYCKTKQFDSIWVIGGAEIYKQFLELDLIHIIHVTEIDSSYECDTFFPNIFYNYYMSQNLHENVENNTKLTFKKFYKKIN
tara:strand:- start:40 stop:543 length:504 start_codon:yes stop_codon:yes gene_type:complete